MNDAPVTPTPLIVRVFHQRSVGGGRVVVFPPGSTPAPEALSPDAMSAVLARCDATRGAVLLPPRRDDCAFRVRVWSTRRELPFSVGAVLAAAAVLPGSARWSLELGVVRVAVSPVETPDGEGWTMALPRTVVGGPLDAPATVAEALGLAHDDLAHGLPVATGSAGTGYLLVPLRSANTLLRARVDPLRWHRVVEKARVVGVLAFAPPEGGVVRCRSLPVADDVPEDVTAGAACGPLGVYLRRHVATGPPRWRMVLGLAGGSHVGVSVDGPGEGDGAVQVSGATVTERP